MHHDLTDLGSLILICIIPKGCTLIFNSHNVGYKLNCLYIGMEMIVRKAGKRDIRSEY